MDTFWVKCTKFFAYVYILVSLIGAVVLWKSVGIMKIPYHYSEGAFEVPNPTGRAISIFTAIQGIIGASVLLVVCEIASDTHQNKEINIAILKNLTKQEEHNHGTK